MNISSYQAFPQIHCHQNFSRIGLIFGDQLNLDSELFAHLNRQTDLIVMQEVLAESLTESSIPKSSWQRSTLFLTAMRCFAEALIADGWQVLYIPIEAKVSDFTEGLQWFLEQQLRAAHQPEWLSVLVGDYTLKQRLDKWAKQANSQIRWLADRHFIAEPGAFSQWMQGKKQPRMEYWYRYLRQKSGYLMTTDVNGKNVPEGGAWNFDKENRKAFAKTGPEAVPKIKPNALGAHGQAVVQALASIFDRSVDHWLPWLAGDKIIDVAAWGWPYTREQALEVLAEFITHSLPQFGDYQDAMWQDQPWLFHSRISAALNLKLLNPREVIEAAVQAYQQGHAPLNAVEGFVRQILGWREYVRGLYWWHRSHWLAFNALQAQRDLPEFYWTGKTHMNCMAQSLQQVLRYGYGHHIQRLMVTGLFSLLYGIKPEHIHQWYLGMYVDAVAWVEIPNTIGMSQFADGGIVGSKPYIASGAYINKMSNYCRHCRYDPKKAVGEEACPMTTLYWDFIARHPDLLAKHPRLGMQWKHWQNKTETQQKAIRQQAQWLFENVERI